MLAEDAFHLVFDSTTDDQDPVSRQDSSEIAPHESDRVFRWENSRFTISIKSGPSHPPLSSFWLLDSPDAVPSRTNDQELEWNEYIPRVETSSKASPFSLFASFHPKGNEYVWSVLNAELNELDGSHPALLYTPEEAIEIEKLADEGRYALEACRFIKRTVEEVYPGIAFAELGVSDPGAPRGVANLIAEFALIEETEGAGWSRKVWESNDYRVEFLLFDEDLLHISSYFSIDGKPKHTRLGIVALPQLVGSDLAPLLYIPIGYQPGAAMAEVCLTTDTSDEEIADRLLAQIEGRVATSIFMRQQVAEHYPNFVL